MSALAYVFHMQPSELWELSADDFEFWAERLEEVSKWQKSQ